MDPVTDHLDGSAPRGFSNDAVVAAKLSELTNRITTRRRIPRRRLAVAALVVLALGGATAAAAGNGLFSDLVDDHLGQHADADFVIEIDVDGVTYTCWGGIAVMPVPSNTDFKYENYLAAKHYIQDHDWSDLKPDPSLLMGFPPTADALATTAARSMIETMRTDGLGVESITTRGTAECES